MAHALSVQINDLDSYQLTPLRLDQFPNVPKVPVLRVYGALRVPGALNLAYPVLVHLHNYYPYLYLDCLETDERKLSDAYLERLRAYLEQAIAELFRRRRDDSDDDSDAEPEASDRFIASIAFCRGTPVYGYHLGYSVLLKVLFLLPTYKARLFRLLSAGQVDFSSFASAKSGPPEVYEAHINYPSQFLADLNCYGCSWLELSKCHFRLPLINASGIPLKPLKEYLSRFIAHNNVLSPRAFPRMGRTLLEVDAHVGDVLNRHRLVERPTHADFAEFNQKPSDKELYLSSLRITFDDLKYQCISRNRLDTSQLLKELYSQVFENIGVSGYNSWETMPHYKDLMDYAAKLNRGTGITQVNTYFDKVIRPELKGSSFPTAFEIVDLTMPLTYYNNVPLLNFRDDLVNWKNYEELFDISEESTTVAEPEVIVSSPNDDENNVAVAPPSDLLPVPDSDKDSQIPSSPVNDSNPFEESQDQGDSSKNDLQIFKMTQHPNFSHSIDEEPSLASLLSQNLHFLVASPHNLYEYPIPTNLRKKRLTPTFASLGILDHDYFDPSYFDMADMHSKPLLFANRKIAVPYRGFSAIPALDLPVPTPGDDFESESSDLIPTVNRPALWQYSDPAPSKSSITQWLNETEKKQQYKRARFRSQIEPAITRTNDYKYSYRHKKVARNPSGFLNLSLLHMELHVNTTTEMRPDPKKDAITFIIFHFDDANQMFGDDNAKTIILTQAGGVDGWYYDKLFRRLSPHLEVEIKCFPSEKLMAENLFQSIDYFDPDILSGYEVNASSWGYLIERFQCEYDTNILPRLGRVLQKGNGKFGDRWGYTHTSSIKLNGRHMLNCWRLLRHELSLTSYSLENVTFHLLHTTLPRMLNNQLSSWYSSGNATQLLMFCKYFTHRLEVVLKIIDSQEFVLRNVELSRLIGIDFYSNFYRGSQFKVESILIRIAKPENMLLNSPTKSQVHAMKPLEVIPLIMEPDSNFYKSPLVVLDFQSLYPSIMIAYNYCYSTLLGKIEGFKQHRNSIGYMNHLKIPRGIIEVLSKNEGINISPNGLMFVTSKFRKSILSRMLQEILNMRINVKSVSSAFPEDTELGKLFNSKQLALKLIANVTYGYTSASFSGRMPSSDIADAIVATGRELLLKAIQIIEAGPYNAKVVYGDTDSLFVYFPGRSKADAFKFGRSLANEVTDALPDPVKLKFEKVYHPSVLLAKKRYVGHCYEFEDQKIPKFEAKGIETIRRDGIPAQLKMVGKSLRILFETKNLSQVKSYIMEQFSKILLNKVNVSDFCFAKEVRYGTYKNEKYLPPGAVLAKKKIQQDKRSEPQYRERVPYVVIKDSTKERIKDRSVSPEDYVKSFGTGCPMELDYEHYITRVLIPPLERVFNLMGVNIKEWYRDMPKSTKLLVMKNTDILRISDFVHTEECYKCGEKLDGPSLFLCTGCVSNECEVMTDLALAAKERETIMNKNLDLCLVCNFRNFGNSTKPAFGDSCVNEDCQVYYSKVKSSMEYENVAEQFHAISGELQSLQW